MSRSSWQSQKDERPVRNAQAFLILYGTPVFGSVMAGHSCRNADAGSRLLLFVCGRRRRRRILRGRRVPGWVIDALETLPETLQTFTQPLPQFGQPFSPEKQERHDGQYDQVPWLQ
jgi:hypothetical protein